MESKNQQSQASIADQAAQWLARLPSANGTEQTDFLDWLRQSPAHVREILLAVVLSERLRELARSGDIDPGSPAPNTADCAVPRALFRSSTGERARRAWRTAAIFALLVLPFLLVLQTAKPHRAFETAAGEWRTVTLADGTSVKIGPRSRVVVEFHDQIRAISLAEGEALFEVVRDPRRPFVVTTDLASVRALGTQFAVAQRADRVVVTVSDGSVSVSHLLPSPARSMNASAPSAVTLAAGEQLTAFSNGELVTGPVDVSRELAWTQKSLIFSDGSTVAMAIEEFNRLNKLQLSAEDAIASRPLRGEFHADDPRAFAESVAIGLDAVVIESKGLLQIGPKRAVGTGERRRGSDGHDP